VARGKQYPICDPEETFKRRPLDKNILFNEMCGYIIKVA